MAQTGSRRAGGGHPMFVGVSIGVLLGLCAALAVALYLNQVNPFVTRQPETASKPSERVQAPKPPIAGLPGAPRGEPAKPAAAAGNDSTRFDFYRILPGDEGQSLKRTQPQAATKEVYYLQAGAFQRASDADNLKARLALAGLEAQIQTATRDDKSVWHRVRVGPYSDAQSMSHARDVLRENKIEPSIIKQAEQQPKS
jgi:cell division protein FtsN